MLVLTISMTCALTSDRAHAERTSLTRFVSAGMTVGFIMRLVYRGSPASLGLYIIQTMFTLLSPCGFLAMDCKPPHSPQFGNARC